MSNAVLTVADRRHVSLFSGPDFAPSSGALAPSYQYEDKDGVSKLVSITGVAVFRSGTFRDSMGYQHMWEDIHMDQMVANYNFLKDRGIFKDIPVRAGHPSFLGSDPVKDLIGYVTNLYKESRTSPHDGKTYSYLMADFEIINDGYGDKISSSLWRNRSAEVGSYITNDEMELWPTFMGVAYVDIPAVEGLNFSKESSNHSILFDGSVNQSLIKETSEVSRNIAAENAASAPPPPPPVPTPPVEALADARQEFAKPVSQVHSFTINGNVTSDFAAVQNHINILETAAREQKEFGRKQFVSALLTDGKIVEAQRESMESLALSMDDDQFEMLRTSYNGAPASPVLGVHVAQDHSNESAQPSVADAAATELINAKEIVLRHKASGMNIDSIKKTRSYGLLAANNAVPAGL